MNLEICGLKSGCLLSVPLPIQLSGMERTFIVGEKVHRRVRPMLNHFLGSVRDESTINVAGPKCSPIRNFSTAEPIAIHPFFTLQFTESFLNPLLEIVPKPGRNEIGKSDRPTLEKLRRRRPTSRSYPSRNFAVFFDRHKKTAASQQPQIEVSLKGLYYMWQCGFSPRRHTWKAAGSPISLGHSRRCAIDSPHPKDAIIAFIPV